MIRVIKTDIFRAVRTKMFYAFPFFLVALQILEFLLSAVMVETETGEMQPVMSGVVLSAPNLLQHVGDGMIMLFLGLFIVAFCNDESKNGFLKNAAGRVPDRAFMPISKMIVGTLALFVYIVEAAIIRLAFVPIQFSVVGEKITWTPVPEGEKVQFVTYIVLCILGNMAFTALLVLLHEVLHARAFGMVFAFLFATQLLDQLLLMVQQILKSQFEIFKDMEIGKYLMQSLMAEGYKAPLYSSGRLFAIAAVLGIASACAAIAVSRKKDIA